MMQRHNVKKIITACPHASHPKHEYLQLAATSRSSTTRSLAQLIEEGRLKPTNEVKR
jgi:hypothetical protein